MTTRQTPEPKWVPERPRGSDFSVATTGAGLGGFAAWLLNIRWGIDVPEVLLPALGTYVGWVFTVPVRKTVQYIVAWLPQPPERR